MLLLFLLFIFPLNCSLTLSQQPPKFNLDYSKMCDHLDLDQSYVSSRKGFSLKFLSITAAPLRGFPFISIFLQIYRESLSYCLCTHLMCLHSHLCACQKLSEPEKSFCLACSIRLSNLTLFLGRRPLYCCKTHFKITYCKRNLLI